MGNKKPSAGLGLVNSISYNIIRPVLSSGGFDIHELHALTGRDMKLYNVSLNKEKHCLNIILSLRIIMATL
jgi:hypothetical protein